MFVINHSDTDFVVNYSGQEKTLPSEQIVFIDDAWISWDMLYSMFGNYIAKVESKDIPEEMLYDNQVIIKNNTIYRVEDVQGTPTMFVSNGTASLYFAEGDIPEKLSELTPIREHAQCTGYRTLSDIADYLSVVASNNVKVTFTGLKLIEMPTVQDTPANADPYKPLATVEELEAAKTELTQMIANLPKFEVKVVTKLPTTGEYMKIYLIKANNGQSGDAYDEYIWVDSLKKFEWLGTTRIDLTNYYTKGEVDAKNYLSEDSLGSAIESALNGITDGFVKEEDVGNIVKPYIINKQDVITGAEGEVLYHSGSSVLSQTLLNEGMIVTSEDEMNECKSELPSFKEVFESWKAYSHLNGADNASNDELAAWVYDESLDTIRMPLNSSTITGYVSPKTYSKYDITVRLYSDDSDDDQMGIVGAFAVDTEGKEHTLTFICSPYNNSGTVKWCCKVDHSVYELTSTSYNEIMLVDKTSTVTGSNKPNVGWNKYPNGITVNIKREGNVFTATCSQFNSTTLDPNTTMVVDLDALSNTYPVLNVFKGSAAWGYMSMSQPNSCYENIAISNDDGYIFDVENDQVLEYDNTTQKWVAKDGAGIAGTIGAGRFSFNRKTGKLFYCTGKEIIHIGSV